MFENSSKAAAKPTNYDTVCTIKDPANFGMPAYTAGYDLRRDRRDGQLYAYKYVDGNHVWVQPEKWNGILKLQAYATPNYGVNMPALEQAEGTVVTNDPNFGKALMTKTQQAPVEGLRDMICPPPWYQQWLLPGAIILVAAIGFLLYRNHQLANTPRINL